MFYGRQAELDKLNDMWASERFEFAVIYGRRRVGKTALIREFVKGIQEPERSAGSNVGKTALIREFVKGKKAFFFTGTESTANDNLVSLSRVIGGDQNAPLYRDFNSALTELFNLAEHERLVFIIDEFPYLANAHRGISSELQILIDHRRESSKLMLILCGSSMSFMEQQVLGHQSPLYGRRSAQLKILPFTFFGAQAFLKGFSSYEQVELYGMTGGIPEYLNRINNNKSVAENISALFLDTSGVLFEEPANLLKQELREPSTYNAIIEAIAHGASKLNEISTKTGLESNKCAKYLTQLITLGLIRKEYPHGNNVRKRSIYRLEDQMFRFWYRFVFPNISALAAGLGSVVYKSEVEPNLNAYLGLVFEDICKQWIYEYAKKGKLPFFAKELGRWWGTNTKTHAQEEIDIMATHGSSALFAECKWSNLKVGEDIYSNLVNRSLLLNYSDVHLYIFAKRGFTNNLLKLESKNSYLRLFSLQKMLAELNND
ncbi:MAG: ATP-binding protein [Coriobacteriales bacterium]|jgi:AAA+ ATPase superfamily predicted ATPase|nr:ATP-binding protein [Coriobacteriales bacterium]